METQVAGGGELRREGAGRSFAWLVTRGSHRGEIPAGRFCGGGGDSRAPHGGQLHREPLNKQTSQGACSSGPGLGGTSGAQGEGSEWPQHILWMKAT